MYCIDHDMRIACSRIILTIKECATSESEASFSSCVWVGRYETWVGRHHENACPLMCLQEAPQQFYQCVTVHKCLDLL
jgi:hypothetical protein